MAAVTGEQDSFAWLVGIDWATAAHQICVLDPAGTVVHERVVDHTGPALAAFVAWLTQLADGALDRVAVAIEVPRGAVVETLLERGAAVFTLNPKQVDRFRDRISMAGAKDDRRDAWVLAQALCTDRHACRRVAVDDPRVIQLRDLARAAEDLAHDFNRLTNRLREQVYRIAPEWLTLSANAADPWFWALVEQVPTPAAARRVRRATVARVLRDHRIRRVTADEVRDVLQRPPVHVAAGTTEAATRHIALLIPRLRLVHAQRQACARELEALLTALAADGPGTGPTPAGDPGLSDVTILRSAPGVGRMVTATLLAEAAPAVAARDYAALRALSGLAPVTRQSGTRRLVSMRRACNGRLREAMYHWARTSTMFDTAAKAYYARLRARGHSHGRALRSLADRWLRTIIAMLVGRTLYDPTHPRRHADAPLITAVPV